MYDAIVIGARCAGSPTAMLLARNGWRVLLVDRSTFPSDTLSAHYIHHTGIAALKQWQLLDQIVASGCPPVHQVLTDLGDGLRFMVDYQQGMVAFGASAFPLPSAPGAETTVYCPRRRVLDA